MAANTNRGSHACRHDRHSSGMRRGVRQRRHSLRDKPRGGRRQPTRARKRRGRACGGGWRAWSRACAVRSTLDPCLATVRTLFVHSVNVPQILSKQKSIQPQNGVTGFIRENLIVFDFMVANLFMVANARAEEEGARVRGGVARMEQSLRRAVCPNLICKHLYLINLVSINVTPRLLSY